jgi:hypothetical protein
MGAEMPEQLAERKGIWVYIKLDGEGLASLPEFDLRWELQDAIEERNIGTSQGSGSGGGWMDFSFEVANINVVDHALAALKNLLTEFKVPDELVRFKIVNQFDVVEDELPDFQPGDCLIYRFEDGDYGAALVLKQSSEQLQAEVVETLLGILDYKSSIPPTQAIFEERKWLISTADWRTGQPYLVWVHTYGGIEIEIIGHTIVKDDDQMICQFHLAWEDIPEYFIRDKYRGNKALNRYERIGDDFPKFQQGDCLVYRFEDGDFGGALVLKRSSDEPNRDETLLGILDYKHSDPPPLSVFEKRKWLLDSSEWRRGQPYLIWANYCWSSDCKEVPFELINHIALSDDPTYCQLGLYWIDIPPFISHEINKRQQNSA